MYGTLICPIIKYTAKKSNFDQVLMRFEYLRVCKLWILEKFSPSKFYLLLFKFFGFCATHTLLLSGTVGNFHITMRSLALDFSWCKCWWNWHRGNSKLEAILAVTSCNNLSILKSDCKPHKYPTKPKLNVSQFHFFLDSKSAHGYSRVTDMRVTKGKSERDSN